jgi:predicted transcriptional regulator
MSLRKITICLPEEMLRAIDAAADMQQQDRNFVIIQAVTHYLSLQEYHRALIEEGIRQDNEGNVVDHETVLKMVAGLTGRAETPRKSRRDG